MKTLDGEKSKRIRIAVLQLLKTEYPGSLDMRVLQFSLDNLGYPLPLEMMRAHLSYLSEKGYLIITHRKAYGAEIAFATLTAAGWDLIDGHSHEHGIDVAL